MKTMTNKIRSKFLPDDYTRCANHLCDLNMNCRRWLDVLPFDANIYPMTKFEPDKDGKCEYYIEYLTKDGKDAID